MFINSTDKVGNRIAPKQRTRISSSGEVKEREFAHELEEILDGDAVQYTLSDEGREKNQKQASEDEQAAEDNPEQQADLGNQNAAVEQKMIARELQVDRAAVSDTAHGTSSVVGEIPLVPKPVLDIQA